MARFTTFLGATTLAVGLAPSLAAAQSTPPARVTVPSYAQPYYPAPTQPYQGRLILDPKPALPLPGERPLGSTQGLNIEPSPSSPGGLRFLGSEARISPTLSAPTAAEAPPTDRVTETRVPGFRLKVPW
jgi:hypothetical protein